ncbi:ABC-F family ATP-binding cassette domain-containing protein [Paenibacillus sp. Z6-24]
MSLLEVNELTHMYADQLTFQNLSFRLLAGEHAGLVGANGAGKSTLFRLLTGELLPDRGSVEWTGQVQVGFLEQHIVLEPGTTIFHYLQTAFRYLYDIEQEMEQLTGQMAEAAGEDSQLEYILKRYGQLQEMLDHGDFYRIQARIEDISAGLGLREIGLDRDVSTLSGGQKTKLLLAKLLLEQPDVLLLDEPTNYLDEVHIRWLSRYLQEYIGAYMVISHDEHFLNEITDVIFHLDHGTIRRYAGNYQYFLQESERLQIQLQAAYARQSREIEKLEAFIDKNRIRKARQAKSREKMLSRIERIDPPADSLPPRFRFHTSGNPGAVVAEARELQIGYKHPLLKPLDLMLRRGDKIAITGENGTGKSTLLRTLLGQIKPLNGQRLLGYQVVPVYFEQELHPSAETPLSRLCAYRLDLTEKQIRRVLAQCGLNAEQIRQPLRQLSGGEQAKARLAELMLTSGNLLVLDEPTNHLDVRAKQSLQQALMQYDGTILLVSHEPEFYLDWVTDTWDVAGWRLNEVK